MAENYDRSLIEEVAALKLAAAERTGFNDFGDSFFEGPLAAWLNDLRGPVLSDFGRQFLHRLVFRDLCRRLKVVACLNEHPEILEVEIPQIILITGFVRTGTTLLHHLMATHLLSRPLLRWELMEPVPPPISETYTTDPRIAKVQTSIEGLRGTMLEKMHWINAVEPEENTWGFFDCTGLLGRALLLLMPTWGRWLEAKDLKPTFRDFKKLVKLLIWKNPPPSGGYLLLKCPWSALHIRAFSEIFPEAKFIITHRDPFRALISACTLGEIVCKPLIGEQTYPFHEDGISGMQVLKLQIRVFGKLATFAKAESAKVFSVQYTDLMNDAVLTTRSAFDYFGIEVPNDLEKRILAYLEQQRSGKRLAPPKSYGTFAYDEHAVWTDLDVVEYCNFFGVHKERTRLTDTKTGFRRSATKNNYLEL
jgi:hypothetical protein